MGSDKCVPEKKSGMKNRLKSLIRTGLLSLIFLAGGVLANPITFTSSDTASVDENSNGTIITVTAVATIPLPLPGPDSVVSMAIQPFGDFLLFTLVDQVMPSPADGLPASARLSFTVGMDHENPVDIGGTAADNIYVVTIRATDANGDTADQIISVTVNDVNDAPTVSSGQSDPDSDDADTINLDVSGNFNDQDGDTLTYTATGLPTGLSIDLNSGVITGTINAAASASSPFSTVITADDGTLTVDDSFSWTVDNPPPVAVGGCPGSASNDDGEVLSGANIAGCFTDDDSLTFSSVSTFPSSVSVQSNGDVTGTVATNASQGGAGGVYSIVLTATDSQGTSTDGAAFNYTISNLDVVGSGAPLVDQSDNDGETVSYNTSTAFEDDGTDDDTLTFSTSSALPGGLALNPTSGVISGDLNANASQGGSPTGKYTITITASDGQGGSHDDTFDWDVFNTLPTANNDTASIAEDATLNTGAPGVLANDTDADDDTLVVDTVQGSGANVGSQITLPSGALVTILANGAIAYDTNGVFNALDDGDSFDDIFNYENADGEGGGDGGTITVTVNGADDDANITGTVTGTVTEDAGPNEQATADLNHTDIDGDDNDDVWTTQASTAGKYGTLNVTAAGVWTYTLDDSDTDTQLLDDGDTVNDETLNIVTSGGTSTTLTITVNGANDPASITGTNTGAVTEDAGPNEQATANLNHTDVDDDDADDLWTSQSGAGGKYGTLDVTTAGVWTYTLDDSDNDTQLLDDGDTVNDETFNIATSDGTTTTLTITVNGANDPASITGTNTGTVTEDAGPNQQATADLNHSDIDDDDADDLWVAQSGTAGKYGTLDVTTAGVWTYTLDDSDTDTQLLDDGDTVNDETFNIATADGTSTTLTITINGANDAASITGTNTGTVTEDAGPNQQATADLGHTDVDDDDADDLWVAQSGTGGKYGTLDVTTAGVWTYTLDDSDNDTQLLDDGDTVNDETFSIATSDGTSTTLTITINGANDAASITGTVTGSVTEDAGPNEQATANLAHTDVDDDDADDLWVAQSGTVGKYGTLDVTTAGVWTYTLDDSDADTQLLDDGDTVTDETFSVATADGTSTTLTITVNGANDAASITGTVTGTVTEDAGPNQQATANLAHTDVDDDDADDLWVAQSGTGGKYGTLDVTTAGVWTYTLDDSDNDTQLLDDGDTVNDETFSIATSDGTSTTLTITINGANDAASITGTVTGSVTEDAGPNEQATANLAHTDVDDDDADDLWVAQSGTVGKYGTLDVTTAGVWTYTLDDSDNDTQLLDDGDTVTDETFSVATADGTSTTLTITVNGANDAASITGTVTGTVTEDAGPNQQATANLAHTDVDDDDADDLWVAQSGTGGKYGTLDVTTAGVWTYTLDDSDNDTQLLDDGDTVNDETFSIATSDGTSTTLTITINGANDAASITGTVTGSVTEDAGPNEQATANLAHTDVDDDDADDLWVAQSGTVGKYGTLDVTTAGVWTYTLDDSDADTQLLDDGDTVTDETFSVATADGTSTTLTITVNGANDAASITGTVTGTVTEDAGPNQQATANLAHTDVDDDDADDLWVAQSGTGGKYGTLDVTTAGVWTYTLDDSDNDTQLLDDGDTVNDETFSIATSDGTSTTLTITINGADDAAAITGTNTGTVTEDAGPNQQATADLGHTDVDDDDADDLWTAQTGSVGKYGSLDVTTAGVWTYTLDDSDVDTQLLDDGDTVNDETFTISTTGGTGVTLTITINGANDAASISGTVTGTVTEDAGPNQQATADLGHSDVDDDDADDLWTAQSGTVGKYGTLDLTTAGIWTYTLDDSDADTQLLDDGDTVNDETFSVATSDGTTTTLTITINGANDDAVITGTNTGTVTEDAGPNQQATADLAHTDVDDDDADDLWVAQTGSTGKYGSLDVTTAGVWTYTLDDADADTQLLDDGDTVNDETFNIVTSDGTSTTLTITINGANDAASISGTVTGTVTEDAGPNQQATANLGHTDVDDDDADDLWTAQTGTVGKYGTLDVSTAGVWTYTLDDSDADTQALDDGDTVNDETFSIATSDGTTTTLTITVNGANDAASITGTVTGTVTEDAGPNQQATANLGHTDVDDDDADDLWTAQTGTVGKYGTLDVSTAGVWTYTLDDSDADTQLLDDGDTVNDETFSVATSDGTTTTLTLTINGANDAASITGTVTGTVTEDAGPNQQSTADLGHTDVDDDDAADLWTAQSATGGTYGSLDVTTAGVWTYTLNDADSDTTVLDVGDVVSDETFTVATTDGTSTTVTITVNGANDNPEITSNGGATVDVNFNENSTATITTIAADDVDGDDGSSGVALTYDIDLTGGADGGDFTINTSTGALSFTSAANFEAQADDNSDNVYEVTVRANDDSGGTDTQLIRVTLLNVNEAPTATNMTDTVAYTEDAGTVNLTNIVVSDIDDSLTGQNISVTLTLNDTDAGSLSGGATYNSGSGVWTITDTVANVNTALAAVSFVTAADHDTDTTITTQVADQGGLGPINGVITLDVTPVNDAPTATNLTDTVTYTEDDASVNLDNIVVSDVDDADYPQTITATLTLADVNAGELTTSGTATYSTVSGIWTITGSLTDVNSALAAVAFEPTADYDTDTTITTQIDDSAAGPGGTITLDVTPVNDPPTATNTTGTINYDEDSTGVDALQPDIVISDVDDNDVAQTITVTLTLSDNTAVTFNTPGGSSFNSATGVWTISNTLSAVNAALASLTFDATTDYDLDSSFTVSIEDQDSTGPAGSTITLDVNPINDAPVINNQTFSVDENAANGTVVGTVTAVNVESDVPWGDCRAPTTCQVLSFMISAGAFAIDSDGQITVSDSSLLDREAYASLSPTVTVDDDGTPQMDDDAVITINLNPVNDNTPVGVDDVVPVDELATINFNVLTHGTDDSDADQPAETLSVSEVDGDPAKVGVAQDLLEDGVVVGSLTINSDGSATFVANSDNTVEKFAGTQTYTVSDGTFEDTDIQVSIDVNPRNDNQPTLTADGTALEASGVTFDEGQHHEFNKLTIVLSDLYQDLDIDEDGLLDSSTSGDNDSLDFAVTSNSNSSLIITSITDGDLMIYSPGDAHGTANLTVTATDTADPAGNISSVNLDFTITVNSINDAPIYVNGSYSDATVNEDAAAMIIELDDSFTDNDIDVDGDPSDDSHTYTITIDDVPAIPEISAVFDETDNEATLISETLDVPSIGARRLVYETTDTDFEIEFEPDGHGVLTVTVRATDLGRPPASPAAAVPLFDEETFVITVQGVGDDTPVAADYHYSDFPALVIDEDSDEIIFDPTENDYKGDVPTEVIAAGVTIVDSFGAEHTWRSTSRMTDRDNTGDFTIETNGEVGCANTTGCQDDETVDTSINAAGIFDYQVMYKPELDFFGEDEFIYCVQDAFPGGEAAFNRDTSDPRCATITVQVNPVNDLPRVPADIIYTMDQADDLLISAGDGLATKVSSVDYTHIDGQGCDPNDEACTPDPNIDTLYFFFESAVTAHGQLIPPFATDGSFNYRPSASFAGSDSFLFNVCETAVPSADTCIFDQLVTIVVEAIAGAPPGLSDDVVEVDFDLANIPLELPVGPEANVLIVNDDSGSMAWDILTDQSSGLYFFSTGNYIYYTMKATAGSSTYVAPGEEDSPNAGLWRLRNSTYSTVYYNPDVRYDPWNGLDPDDNEFPQASITQALHNPMSPNGSTTNLRTPQDYTGRAVVTTPVTCETVCYSYSKGTCTSYGEQCTGGSGWQQVQTNDLYLPRHYIWDDKDSDGLLDDVPSPILDPSNSEGILVEIRPAGEGGGYPTAGTGLYPRTEERTDCVTNADSCTYDEEIQNFANWFTYSRNREFTAKSALGKTIAAAENIRVGYAKLNNESNLKEIVSLNSSERTGEKAELLDAIYLTQSSGGTPLRRSLRDAGRHFECVANDIFDSSSSTDPGEDGCPVFEAPAGNCQQNFTLLISDGAWNGYSPFSGTPDYDDDDNTNFDGGVYAGSYNESLADVSMHYYERDLQGDLLNEVPTSARDVDGAATDAFEDNSNDYMHQHMKTYTIGFGVNGLVEDGDVPTDYTQSFNWGNPTSTERKIDDMRHAAVNGRGQYLSAGNASSLADSLNNAFEEFQQGSGAASAVSFNSQEILEDTLVFRSFYNTKNNTGNLLAQGIDENGVVDEIPTWTAADRLDLKTFDTREIITFDRNPLSATYAQGIPFRPTSITDTPLADTGVGLNSIQRLKFIADTGVPQAQQDLEVLQRVNYLRGDDSNERPTGNLRERPGVEGRLGDIVHSAPTFIGIPSRLGRDADPFPQTDLYSQFRETNELRQPVVYVSANDGMIHGFDAETGDELIAYIPDNLMTNTYSNDITDLLDYEYTHEYYVDSTPAVNDVYMDADGDGNLEWRTILISAQGHGGKAYVALDITDPTKFDESTANDVAMWEFTDEDDTYPTDSLGNPLLNGSMQQRQDLLSPPLPVKDLGYTYSVPTIVMSNLIENDEHVWVSIFGNGYNSTAGIAKLFVLFLDGGIDSVWCHPDMIHTPVLNGVLPTECVGKQDFVKLDTGFGVQGGLPNGLGEPRAIDVDGNGTVDYAYAGDMQGNFFRFDLTSDDFNEWTVTKIFKAQYKPGTADETDQPITTQPIAIIHPSEEEGFIIIFGSGAYMRTGDANDDEIQSIYGIWDRLGPELILKSDLQEQEFKNFEDPLGFVRTLTAHPVDYSIVSGQRGWFIDLDPAPPGLPDTEPPQFPGEKAVRNIQLRGGLAFVNSIFPRPVGSCVTQAGGATLAFCPDTGGSLCFGNRTIFDINNDGAWDTGDDINTDQTAAGVILGEPEPPTDSTFVGDYLITQYGNELHIIGTNTSSGSNTGRLSWKRLETVE